MMFFKPPRNAQGFILSEVVMAIAIIGFLLTSLLVLQATVFKRVMINTFRINRLYPMKNFLTTDALLKGQKIVEKKDEALAMKLIYEKKDIKPTSSLFRFKGLYQKQVTGTWFEQTREKTQMILTYSFETNEKNNDGS